MISCNALNDWVDLWFTGEAFGHIEIIERVTVPGANHAAEIATVNAAIDDLTAQFTSEAIPELLRREAAQPARRAQAAAGPAGKPDQIQERATGVTVAEHWKTLDSAGKRRYLAGGVKVVAARDEDGVLDSWLTGASPSVIIGTLRGLSYGTGYIPNGPFQALSSVIESDEAYR